MILMDASASVSLGSRSVNSLSQDGQGGSWIREGAWLIAVSQIHPIQRVGSLKKPVF